MKFDPTHTLTIEPDGGKAETLKVMCLGPVGTKDKKSDPGPLMTEADVEKLSPIVERREKTGMLFVATDPIFEACEWSYDDMGNILRNGSYAPWGLATGKLTLQQIEGSTIPAGMPKVSIPDIGVVAPVSRKKTKKESDDERPFDPVSETELDSEALVDGLDDD